MRMPAEPWRRALKVFVVKLPVPKLWMLSYSSLSDLIV
jgi:hypothetical protein